MILHNEQNEAPKPTVSQLIVVNFQTDFRIGVLRKYNELQENREMIPIF